MDKAVNNRQKQDHESTKLVDKFDQLVSELELSLTTNLNKVNDISVDSKSKDANLSPSITSSGDLRSISTRMNDIYDSYSRNLISQEEFTKLMEEIKKDKEQVLEIYRKDRIKHRMEDYQGMLNVFTSGSQAFLTTKDAIAQLNAML